jgi:hypothetical protein
MLGLPTVLPLRHEPYVVCPVTGIHTPVTELKWDRFRWVNRVAVDQKGWQEILPRNLPVRIPVQPPVPYVVNPDLIYY